MKIAIKIALIWLSVFDKNKLLLIAVLSATLAGCVSLSKPFSNSDNTYKILDTPKNVIETDINNRIINYNNIL